jgi:MerR family mercuric resistance operon transcriptional regulator
MMRRSGLSIGRLAALTGVHLETVRYYERIGLMPVPERTDGGHRVYAEAHRRHLAFVQRARKLGFSIEDIRALLALAEPQRRSCREVEAIASAHLQNVRSKIADLRRLEDLLQATVSHCGSNGPSCPVLEILEGG